MKRIIFPVNVKQSHWIILWYEVDVSTLFIADSKGYDYKSSPEIERVRQWLLRAVEGLEPGITILVLDLAKTSDVVPQQFGNNDRGVFTCAFGVLVAKGWSLQTTPSTLKYCRLLVFRIFQTGEHEFWSTCNDDLHYGFNETVEQ